ncbi:MAG: 16S rRNA (cytosine(967)-C(5))-methyltransferase RsmB [Bacilli bacterium]|nr:16S rRNA (cytosine(967)-C(5))-methyltransferase RsmB [Bacilli bacterium]
MNPRRIAMDAIERILYKGGYSNVVISDIIHKYVLEDKDKALVTKLVLGTVENRITLEYYLEPFLKKKQKTWIHILLLMSLYQLVYLNIPDAVVVNEAVEIANNRDRAIGSFVNAVLRNFLRTPRRGFEGLDDMMRLSIQFSYPTWLVAYLLKDYDAKILQEIFDVFAKEQKDAIRINTLKTTKEEVKELLMQENIGFLDHPLVQNGLLVDQNLLHHPLFKEGKITIQAISSQLVAEVLNPSTHATILDLCSAPGGKDAHLAALMNNGGSIFACDIHEHKLNLMKSNFDRLGVANVKTQLIDARQVYLHVKEESFDDVLADLPCSGLGVMGHKVDLKYHITLESIQEVMNLQKEILSKVTKLPKIGGHLIISTCTINKAENEELTKWFIEHYPQYQIIREMMLLPHEVDSDGFYICKLRRMKT